MATARPRVLHACFALQALLLAGPAWSPGRESSLEDNEAAALLARAEKLRDEGRAASYGPALLLFEQARAAYAATADRGGQADALAGIGRCRDSLGEKEAAIGLFHEARKLYQAVGRKGGEAAVLNFEALTLDSKGRRPEALALLNEALPLATESLEPRVRGLTLNNLGLVYFNMGERRKAIEFCEKALPFHREASNLRGEATSLANIGTTWGNLGEPQKALDYLEQSLALRRQVGSPRDLATTFNNMGAIHFGMDEFGLAVDLYNQALPQWREAGDKAGEAATLHNIANVNEFVGEYHKALDFYLLALPLHRASSSYEGEANTLNNIGRLYNSLGERETAIRYLSEALPVQRRVKNAAGETAALVHLGSVHVALGDGNKAAGFFEQAKDLARRITDRGLEANALVGLGRVHASRHDFVTAIDYYTQALTLQQAIGSRRGEATTLGLEGSARAASGPPDEARRVLERAAELAREVSHKTGEAYARYELARLEARDGNLGVALRQADAALALIESLRASVAGPELRSSFLATLQDYFDLDIDLLMRLEREQPHKGYAGLALAASERAHARSLLDLLVETQTDLRTGVEADLLADEQRIEEQLNAKAARLARAMAASPPDQPRAQRLQQEIEALAIEYEAARARIRARSPRYAELTAGRPVQLREIQADLLDPETVLVEYWLGQERSYVWAITRDKVSAAELPPRAVIDAAARRFMTSAGPRQDAVPSLHELSGLILRPIAERLGTSRIVVIADGALQYVPFAALTAIEGAYRPLVMDHELVMLPSASVLAALRAEARAPRPALHTLAIVADPVFQPDDPRVISNRAQGAHVESGLISPQQIQAPRADERWQWPRLIGSRREADRIAALVAPKERREALDFEASRDLAAGVELGNYRLVHFATHGVLDSSHPALSSIVLSLVDRRGQPLDGFLRLHDIYSLRLSCDLVVLSACQTALGKDVRGEGILGLTRGFMYAGSPRVVASLWKVDDRATAELMARFYQAMLGPDRLRPAAALRAAQIAVARQPAWSSPAYWAAFELQGEWR